MSLFDEITAIVKISLLLLLW